MIRVRTLGSVFEIDEALGRYRRMPREERPRERPEWGGPDAGPLRDFAWLPMGEEGWRIDDRARLLINLPDDTYLVAPLAYVVGVTP